jgi:hypothetical protein
MVGVISGAIRWVIEWVLAHRVTVTFSRAERRAASRTSRAAAASRAVTGFSPVPLRAAATAA